MKNTSSISKTTINKNPTNNFNQPKPSLESLGLQKFLNKPVLQVQNEWEDLSKKIKIDIKRLGLSINKNENDMRKSVNKVDLLKISQKSMIDSCKTLQKSLDLIIESQESLEMEFDILEADLDYSLQIDDLSAMSSDNAKEIFSNCESLSKQLYSVDLSTLELKKEINTGPITSNMNADLNKSINNYLESLSSIEGTIKYINQMNMKIEKMSALT